jgi:methylenetetrahydrofolate dehydrogenase (NADP+) / methenyltetrahydrofolate cyclohydrolase
MKILDGKVVRDEIMVELKKKIEGFKVVPTLAIIKIGDNPDSDIYVKRKLAFAKKIGANAFIVDLTISDSGEKKEITQKILLDGVEKLNKDKTVHGIIIQSPLPEPLNWAEAVEKITPEKDVDGVCSVNVENLLANNKKGIVPATARGVLSLLNYYKIPLVSKKACPPGVSERRRVVVMGRSALVGYPIAVLMKNNGAEVTVVHSQTKEPEKITREADILIVAIGKPELVGAEYVKEGQVIIDVGISAVINADGTRKIYGDVDYNSVSPIVSAISPVPGGVGPMTVASLFQNLVESCKKAS